MNERRGFNKPAFTTHAEDKALVIEAIAGNQKAYNILLSKYKPILYTAAKRRLPKKNVEDLEDIVMFVLGTAFVRINQYNPEKSLFYTWMISCLHNHVNGIPAQKKRIVADSIEDIYPSNRETDTPIEYEIPDEDPFDLVMDFEQTAKLIRLLVDKLPEESCQVIKLRYFKQLTHKEIGAILGCEERQVWYKLDRAKQRLKKLSDKENLF
jgi:RNA polymerase sigma factor (sigma-70 family)